MINDDQKIVSPSSTTKLPKLSSRGMPQNYSTNFPAPKNGQEYPQSSVQLPQAQNPVEVVVVDDNSRKQSIVVRTVEHHYNLVKGCTFGQFTSNSTYNKLYLKLLIHDYKVLIRGHEAFDKMMFLEEQGLAIKETMAHVHGVEVLERIERNITMLKLSLMTIGCFWLFSLFGFVDGIMDLVLSQNLTSLLILSCLSKGFFLIICSCFYLAYCYHTYAALLDRFISAKEYFSALLNLDAEAWFPFIYK